MVLAVIAGAVPAAAQTAAAPAGGDSRSVSFLANAQFYLGAEHLFTDSEQFRWEANYGGSVDFLDWVSGRATFYANYQVMMGEEFKAFDPNQGNYILGLAGSTRVGSAEFGGIFEHESRHLGDRPKTTPVDWNMIGMRVQRRQMAGRMLLDAEGQFFGVVQKSYVDYSWRLDGRVRGDVTLRPAVGVFLIGAVRALGVDGSRDRGTQTGGRAEGGVRIDGVAGAAELFVAFERRIDPAVLEFGTMNWTTVGFRLVSR